MAVLLKDRTESTVRIYYEKSQQTEIKTMLPQNAKQGGSTKRHVELLCL